MNVKTKLAAVMLSAGMGFLATSEKAQAYSHRYIGNLAGRLQRQTGALHHEVHAHFRLTRDYRHLNADVTNMERLARHIHDAAHRRDSVRHIRSDERELDRLFHHIEGLVRRMVVTGQMNIRTIVHFRSIMAQISNTLHHLRDGLRDIDSHNGHGSRYGGYRGGHGGRVPVSGGSRGGIRFGNSRFGVNIRF